MERTKWRVTPRWREKLNSKRISAALQGGVSRQVPKLEEEHVMGQIVSPKIPILKPRSPGPQSVTVFRDRAFKAVVGVK